MYIISLYIHNIFMKESQQINVLYSDNKESN